MGPPSDDDPNSPDDAPRTGVERDEIEPVSRDEMQSGSMPTPSATPSKPASTEQASGGDESPEEPTEAASTATAEPTTESTEEPAVEPTDESAPLVDSNWWYAVAAVPLYFVVGVVGGIAAVVFFFGAVAIDIGGGMGVASGLFFILAMLAAFLFAAVGTILLVLFPVGIYLDAKAVADAPVDWEPDPVLYGLVAAATALFSALTISLIVALYYLYRRSQRVGIP